MILYSPLDGDATTTTVPSAPRHCFLMTRLGKPVPPPVLDIRRRVSTVCARHRYKVIDASTRVTGRDFLLKIWHLIASAPLAVGVVHELIPAGTQANIYYELGVAQALGKETVLLKSPGAEIPSDFVRNEYIVLITGDKRLRAQAKSVLDNAALEQRARNSVEVLASKF